MSQNNKTTNENRTAADMLYIAVNCRITAYYKDGESLYCTMSDSECLFSIPGRELEDYIRLLYLEKHDRVLSSETVRQVVSTLAAIAATKASPDTVHQRVAQGKRTFYYDLKDGNVVIANSKKVFLKPRNNVRVLFKDSFRCISQVVPDLTVEASQLPELLEQFFRTKEEDLLLFTCYLVSCFIENIDHPILVLQGPPGTGKSSFLSNVSRLIDPMSGGGLYQLPRHPKDLAAIINTAHFVGFDNIDRLTKPQSDFFCQVVTGAAVGNKALYTNFDIAQVELHGCVALNGIDGVATQRDLLSRALLLELTLIQAESLKPKSHFQKDFAKALPQILGGCFHALCGALNVKEPLAGSVKTRMVDFGMWGYRIAEAVHPGWGRRFLNDYEQNQARAQSMSSGGIPVVLRCLGDFVNAQGGQWQGSMTNLREELYEIACSFHVDLESFPRSAASLSRLLHERKSDMQNMGIQFYQKNGGNRLVTLISC